MTSPLLDREYHVLDFDRATEAAAFVAALSRFLNSPVGSTYIDHPDLVEVWTHVASAEGHELVQVFLSQGALDAASAAFAPVLVSGTRRGDELPQRCALIIRGERMPSWGLAEVEHLLFGRRA